MSTDGTEPGLVRAMRIWRTVDFLEPCFTWSGESCRPRDEIAILGAMRFEETPLAGAVVVEIEPHVDDRGAFARVFCADEFAAAGLPIDFPQCNLSINDRVGTMRGMHFNVEPHGESKLVRCVRGAVHDVIVDLRPDSPTRWQHVGVDLTADNRRALFVPAGFAHGFITLADQTDVYYHMGARYEPGAARGIRWDDPALEIEWPITPRVMSPADAAYADLDPATFDLMSYES
jgi:dTDP-4-dehydrorhamnose 3,5-epimerase